MCKRSRTILVLLILESSLYLLTIKLLVPPSVMAQLAVSSSEHIVVEGVTETLSLSRVTLAQTEVVSATMYEDFEGDWPAPGWTVTDESNTDGGEYMWGQRDCHPYEGIYGLWAVGGGAQGSALTCDAFYPNNARSWAIYGPFDLSDATSASLIFYLYGRIPDERGCSTDRLFVGSSTDADDFSGTNYCGDYTSAYVQQVLDLSDRLGESEVWIAFGFISDGNATDIGLTVENVNLISSSASPPLFARWSSIEDEGDWITSVAWGDYDGDGDLDLAVGNRVGYNYLYRNEQGTLTPAAVWSSAEKDDTTSVAWGDYDGDGDLDLAVGNGDWDYGQPNRLYRNEQGTLTAAAVWSSDEWDDTMSVAWGDYDGDGDLDLAVGNTRVYSSGCDCYISGENRLYRNEQGALTTNAMWGSDEWDDTESVAWGDYDRDGDLDLAVGNYGDPNRLYRNDQGTLSAAAVWSSDEEDPTYSVAWGDYDGDGDLDLAAGNWEAPNRLYRNDEGTLAPNVVWSSTEVDHTSSVVWGDYDSDGDLDLAVGNWFFGGEPNRLYHNDGDALSASAVWSFAEVDETWSVAWGDYDRDGDLDLAMGNVNHDTWLYRNDGGTLSPGVVWSSIEEDYTESVAWGDYDGDGDLDLAVGNGCLCRGPVDYTCTCYPNRLYRNDNGALISIAVWSSAEADNTQSVAWGDYDQDGDLDLVVGNGCLCEDLDCGVLTCHPSRLYRNTEGMLTSSAMWSSDETEHTMSVAWGDYDGDGDLDLAVGNVGSLGWGAPNRLYRNDGGTLTAAAVWGSDEWDDTESVAWGDYDGDGDLDLAVGNWGYNRLYRNDQGTLIAAAMWSSEESDATWSMAWGDYDGDGDLDLAAGNFGDPNRLYRNDEGALTSSAVWSTTEVDDTCSIAWGDYDGDGDLDLAAGNGDAYYGGDQANRLYRNDGGMLTEGAVWSSIEENPTSSIAWGDYNGDGNLDLAVGNKPTWDDGLGGENHLYRNGRHHYGDPANIPIVSIAHPGKTANADLYSASQVWTGVILPVTYTLYHRDSLPVREIHAYYSLNGGGQWFTATATADAITTNLASAPYPEATDANTHVFNWNIQGSGVMGQYDNVVFRLVAIPAIVNKPNGIPGPYQFGSYASSTFPFRVRGNQVRVLSGAISSAVPVVNALVYRLPAGETGGGALYASATGEPFRTNGVGYLQGHGEIHPGDRLLALVPITYTDSYTLYYTNGTPTADGVDAYTVSAFGVQTLTVSAAHPLYLFNLDVALEWDAHNDAVFMEKLEYDLQRASEYLYDFTDGQAALGEVYVFHNAEAWQTAHLRIYANNRLRPNAVMGGVVSTDTVDVAFPLTLSTPITYMPGQIRMPAIWNRYGDPGGAIGEDWSRTLAHEFGHYYLFLDDHYLGYDEQGQIISLDTCTNTAMTDPYRYTEYRDQGDWLPDCQDTIAQHLTGRSDWATIELFYPVLTGSDTHGTNNGPVVMPFDFTEITLFAPLTPTDTLPDPTFYFLDDTGQRYQPTAGTRGFLIQEDAWLIDAGEPVVDHLLARGAKPGDRLCVIDAVAHRLGCEAVRVGDDQMVLYAFPEWQPELIVAPITTNTIAVTVHTAPHLTLHGRILPTEDPATAAFAFSESASGTYETTMTTMYTDVLLLQGFVQIWVAEPAPRREMLTDYAIGASPGWSRAHGGWSRAHGGWSRAHGGWSRAHGGWSRAHGGWSRAHGAPLLSSDGQVTLYTPDPIIPKGEFLTIQAATGHLPLPAGRVQVGQAYRIAATVGITNLSEAAVSFQYIGATVPAGLEEDLTIYYWDENEEQWQARPTTLNIMDNFASAPMSGGGLYALLTAYRIPLQAPGWNLFSYPLRQAQPVTTALVSISGYYTTVYGHQATDPADPWKVYDVTAPGYVNDLATLEFGQGYWISVSHAITAYIGTAAPASSLALNSLPPQVPATYYGEILAGHDFTPVVGEDVTAWIGDTLCGQSRTQEVTGQVVYAVNVLAEVGGLSGCGQEGQLVTFQVAGQPLNPAVEWDDSHVWKVPLSKVTVSPTPTPSPTNSTTAVPTVTATLTLFPTSSTTATPTTTATSTPFPTSAATPTPTTTATPTPFPTGNATPTSSITPSPSHTAIPFLIYLPLILKEN